MKLLSTLVILGVVALAGIRWMHPPLDRQPDDPEGLLTSLGINANDEILESSGLANSSHVPDAIWTLNDSGNVNEIYLLKTDGQLAAKVKLRGAINQDWEAMAGFEIDNGSWLLVADVGDNLVNRKSCELYLLAEPDLSTELDQSNPAVNLPIKTAVRPTKIEFSYEDGPKNCEAIGVDVVGKRIWLVEKTYYDAARKTPPGIYTLPLSLAENQKPLIAKRVADFPPRNVTGMAFSPDGKRLIIRNYVNAHLYSRTGAESWESVVLKTKPATVVLPLQRQGEAVCFTPDSKSVILTSELKRQPIWQVNLRQHLEQAERSPEKSQSEK